MYILEVPMFQCSYVPMFFYFIQENKRGQDIDIVQNQFDLLQKNQEEHWNIGTLEHWNIYI